MTVEVEVVVDEEGLGIVEPDGKTSNEKESELFNVPESVAFTTMV